MKFYVGNSKFILFLFFLNSFTRSASPTTVDGGTSTDDGDSGGSGDAGDGSSGVGGAGAGVVGAGDDGTGGSVGVGVVPVVRLVG